MRYTDKNDANSLKRSGNVKQLEKYYQKLIDEIDEQATGGKVGWGKDKTRPSNH